MAIKQGLIISSVISFCFLTTACSDLNEKKAALGIHQNTNQDINQTAVCEVNELNAKDCKPGQKIVFLPQSWGNEQLPILFAAINCDLRFSVVKTNGGVVCIYYPLKPAETEKQQQKTAPQTPPKS